MTAHQMLRDANRPTRTEEVFLALKADIVSLKLAPGSKISEVDVAKTFEVSRQPVREAFMRLSDLNLIEIRPQRATRVRKISHQGLSNTRFIRAAVEVEVVRLACKVASDAHFGLLEDCLEEQRAAVQAENAELLRALDYRFHELICLAAHQLPAFKVITENKAHTDRACTLEFADADGMREVLEGHEQIYHAIKAGDEEAAVESTRIHLRHLDDTLVKAVEKYPSYFED